MKTLPTDFENVPSIPEDHNNEGLKVEPFVVIENEEIETVKEILKDRFPRASQVYNMVTMTSKFPSIKLYSIHGVADNSIFVLIDIRPDYNQEICISVPNDFKICESVKEYFIGTKIIDWSSRYRFPDLDGRISPMIYEISTLYKKNCTTVGPNYFYFMSAKDAANLELRIPEGVEVKPLNFEGANLIVNGWKYKRPGSLEYVQEVAEKGKTAGVYVNGTPVCGMIQYRNGYVGMLYSAKSYRNKGYAKLCMQYLMKQLGVIGYAVASAAECHNTASVEFHKKVGLTYSHYVEDIIYEKGDFESKSG